MKKYFEIGVAFSEKISNWLLKGETSLTQNLEN